MKGGNREVEWEGRLQERGRIPLLIGELGLKEGYGSPGSERGSGKESEGSLLGKRGENRSR